MACQPIRRLGTSAPTKPERVRPFLCLWTVSGFESIHWFYIAVLVALFAAWLTVAVRTVRAMWSGKVIESPH